MPPRMYKYTDTFTLFSMDECLFLSATSISTSLIPLVLQITQKNQSMSSQIFISSLIFLSFTVSCCCYGEILFSSLKQSLTLDASPKPGQVLKAGVDNITLTWGFNQSFPIGTDTAFKVVKVKLCYAPISQKERPWRKTEELVSKDRTCQFVIVSRAYNSSKNSAPTTFDGVIKRNVPTATYFIRAYVYDSHDHPVAYGQTTDANHTTNLFDVQGISGRHASIDICAAVFSGFSVVSLFGFIYKEKKKGMRSANS